jgi:Protein of unknown function (DUF1236)
MRSFGTVACGLVFLWGATSATAQTTVTRQITIEPVETIITRGPNGTVVTRQPLNPAPPAVEPWNAPVEYAPYGAPVVAADDALEPDQTITVRRSSRTTRATPGRVRRQLALTPAQRQIVYRTVVRREVYPRAAVRPAYPPVVAQTEVVEPAPRSYPLRTIYPFQNDNPYDNNYAYRPYDEGRYVYQRYDQSYPNGYVYQRVPTRAAYVVGSRIPESVPLVAVPESVAIQVPATRPYSYAVIDGRVYLVDPVTSTIVADVTQ